MTSGHWIVSALACVLLAGLIGDGIGYKRREREEKANLKPLIVPQYVSEPWYKQAGSCREQYFVCAKRKDMEKVK
jgi:hypothetical protein